VHQVEGGPDLRVGKRAGPVIRRPLLGRGMSAQGLDEDDLGQAVGGLAQLPGIVSRPLEKNGSYVLLRA
jgi:hypothetical protein